MIDINEGPKKRKIISRIHVIDRALKILDALSESKDGLILRDICKMSNLHPSTAYHILATLSVNGFVRQNPDTKIYRLGLELLRLGEASRAQLDLRDIASPYLAELANNTKELVNLVILDGSFGVYIGQANPLHQRTVQMFTQIGARVPLFCSGTGKAILAYFSEEDLEKYFEENTLIAYTENTITNPYQLKKELEKIRQQGYSVDNEEREVGVRCIASSIWAANGQVVGAISISGPSGRISPERYEELGNFVIQSTQKISHSLGYRTGDPV